MANNFCRFLSNGYSIRTDGLDLWYRPCCWFNKEINFNDPNFFQIQKEISEISEWTSGCNRCKKIESSGMYGNSAPRLRSFKSIPDENVANGVPVEVELSIDLTCNAACLSCGPWSSTTWIKQYIKYDIQTADNTPDLIDPLEWFEKIKQIGSFEHIKSVSFLGGEPFKSLIPLKFLKLIKATKELADVTVHFQSNASIVPSAELIKLLRECKRVNYGLSIDGIKDKFNYLRYPLNWKKVIKTLDYVKELKIKNLYFIIMATVNPINVYYYKEIEDWANNFFSDYPKPANSDYQLIRPNRCSGELDLANIPLELKEKIISLYGKTHAVSKMLTGLVDNSYNSNNASMIAYLDKWDLLRKKNWKELFPEVAEYFK